MWFGVIDVARGGFLSDNDRSVLDRFPVEIAAEDLIRCFSLGERDLELVIPAENAELAPRGIRDEPVWRGAPVAPAGRGWVVRPRSFGHSTLAVPSAKPRGRPSAACSRRRNVRPATREGSTD